MKHRRQTRPLTPIEQYAIGVVGQALALGGPTGVGGIPTMGFGPGTPLAGYAPGFSPSFVSETLGVTIPGPASRLPRSLRNDPSYQVPVIQPWMRPASSGPPGYYGGVPMSLFGGNAVSSGGGLFDPNGFGGLVAQTIGGIYNLKHQTKLLKQYNKLLARQGVLAGGVGGTPMIMPSSSNPAVSGLGGLSLTGGGGGGSLPLLLGGGTGLGLTGLPGVAEDVFTGIGQGVMNLVGAGTPARTRAPRLVGSVNNQTGRAVFYRYVGAPILFRGDLTTLKTARKAVSKFGGLAGIRRTFRRRR